MHIRGVDGKNIILIKPINGKNNGNQVQKKGKKKGRQYMSLARTKAEAPEGSHPLYGNQDIPRSACQDRQSN